MDLKKYGEFLKKRPTNLLFVLGLAGLALILLADLFPSKEGQRTQQESLQGTSQGLAYTQQMEAKLTELIEQIEGAGRTQVMITLDAGEENVYALNEKEGSQGDHEWSHIILGTGDGDQALVEMTWQPTIRGVAVVCEGAGNVTVASQITQAVSVLLGVSTNRISIAKMS